MDVARIREEGLGLYTRYGRYMAPIFFAGGVTWDSLTLRRIDQWVDNLILLVYLAALGGMIVIVVLLEAGRVKSSLLQRVRQYLPLGVQFLLGGLLSAYVVFYFKSAALLRSWIFLGLLAALLVANEFLERRLRNLFLLVPLYFLACFSFFTFFIPVAIRVVNRGTFIAAGLLSLGVAAGLMAFFRRKEVFDSIVRYRLLWTAILSLYGLVNVFYVMNWIPPVPLSMTAGGVYHRAAFDRPNDRFVLQYDNPGGFRFWRRQSDPFRYAPGDTVHCFVSIFAPTGLKKEIFHEWQRFDEASEKWVTVDRIPYRNPILGQRDEGYRGLTRKRNIETSGRWRVEIKTPDGLTLGRVPFTVELVDTPVRAFQTRYR